MKVEIKHLPEFSKYFKPSQWRNWRAFTYYRIIGAWFLIVTK
jgi:hypothetical protein